jgi:hypothetical protein
MIVGILLILLLQIIKGLTVEEILLLSFKYVVPCVFYSEKREEQSSACIQQFTHIVYSGHLLELRGSKGSTQ